MVFKNLFRSGNVRDFMSDNFYVRIGHRTVPVPNLPTLGLKPIIIFQFYLGVLRRLRSQCLEFVDKICGKLFSRQVHL